MDLEDFDVEQSHYSRRHRLGCAREGVNELSVGITKSYEDLDITIGPRRMIFPFSNSINTSRIHPHPWSERACGFVGLLSSRPGYWGVRLSLFQPNALSHTSLATSSPHPPNKA